MRLSDKYSFLTNYFENALNSRNRALPQSLLFYGNDTNAQYTLATEIARLLNCKENKDDNCECLNCKWINEGTHPAVMTISKCDNKPADDTAETVISIKQAHMIGELLLTASEFHRVFIFCDRDKDGNICALNRTNFQGDATNALLKIIEEPQPGVTFIFLTKFMDDVLSTIVSRSQCFYVPSCEKIDYDYSCINGIFTDYFNLNRNEVFDLSQKLQDLTKEYPAEFILDSIQNYILALLKANPKRTDFIKHIEYTEIAKDQIRLGMRNLNVFDDLCLKLVGSK